MPDTCIWYSATLLFESRVDGIVGVRSLCEERVVLIKARDERAARIAASRYGELAEHAYTNNRGQLVRWMFVGIDKVEDVGPPIDAGWEVGARFVRRHRSRLTPDCPT